MSRRQLRDLPRYDEAHADLCDHMGRHAAGRTREMNHPGLWTPPASVKEVTFPLVFALFIGTIRHRHHLEYERTLANKVVDLNIARLAIKRAKDQDWSGSWHADRDHGGDPMHSPSMLRFEFDRERQEREKGPYAS